MSLRFALHWPSHSALSTPHVSPHPVEAVQSLRATPATSSPSAALSVDYIVTKPTQHGRAVGNGPRQEGRRQRGPGVDDDNNDVAQRRAEEAASTLPLSSLSHPVANLLRVQSALDLQPPSATETRRDRAPSSVDRLLAGLQYPLSSTPVDIDDDHNAEELRKNSQQGNTGGREDDASNGAGERTGSLPGNGSHKHGYAATNTAGIMARYHERCALGSNREGPSLSTSDKDSRAMGVRAGFDLNYEQRGHSEKPNQTEGNETKGTV
ncbi:hypothetical protein EYR40_006093 [Pleurotus pulmonarius]|nr:hypothetical protein EYR36_010713 [Pleurotus pulmonarius]KAF4599005.1 hypothetical protein EYR40_006093 [Pleurotus pulmonarius]